MIKVLLKTEIALRQLSDNGWQIHTPTYIHKNMYISTENNQKYQSFKVLL